MSRRLKPSARYLTLLIGALVLVIWLLLLRSQFQALASYHWQLNPLAFALALLCAALYFGGLALCWSILLQRMRAAAGQPPTAGQLAAGARIWLLSIITRYIPGNIWHILSRAALAQQLQAPATLVLASATLEQALTLLAALTLFVLTLPLWGAAGLSLPAGWGARGLALLPLALPLGLGLLHPAALGRLLGWAARRLRRPELAWCYRYRDILLLLGGYILATAWSGLALAAALGSLTAIRPAQLPLLIGAAALAWALGYLSFFTPSGLGVREGVLAGLLAQIYPLPVAIAASLIFRLVSTLGELLAVAVAGLIRTPHRRDAEAQRTKR